MSIDLLIPDWPAPAGVRSAISLRTGGVSQGEFASANLGTHVGDDPDAVAKNRDLLCNTLQLPSRPVWLEQVHATDIIKLAETTDPHFLHRADGSYTDSSDRVCVVMTADCLPVLMCNRQGTRVAAVHAGWRGLSAGILRRAVSLFEQPAEEILCYLGPAIGPERFQVGSEVKAAFIDLARNASHLQLIEAAFRPDTNNRFLADIYVLAKAELNTCGVTAIYGGGFCTVSDEERFYSFRRDGRTGRNASLIWLQSS